MKEKSRLPLTYEEAAAEIRLLSGSHFAPVGVDTFMAIAPELLQAIAGRYQDAGHGDELALTARHLRRN